MAGGSVVRKQRANGLTWIYRFQTTRPLDGKRVENTKIIGLVKEIGNSETAAWREVGRLGLDIDINQLNKRTTFLELANHFREHELRKLRGVRVRAAETIATNEVLLDRWILPRWGEVPVSAIRSLEVESWFESLTKPGGLQWPSVVKIKSVMNQIFVHGQRHELIPATIGEDGRPSSAGQALLFIFLRFNIAYLSTMRLWPTLRQKARLARTTKGSPMRLARTAFG